MNRAALIACAAAGSAGLLVAAWIAQYGFGLLPCKICLWQRWPHLAAVLLGLCALALAGRGAGSAPPGPGWAWAGAAAAAATGLTGVYHSGIERQWWPGPSSCTGSGGGLAGLSGADLLSTDLAAPLVMCDQVGWSLLGLSMASWNAVFSLALMAVWIVAASRAA